MTPQERQLVDDLFDRLSKVEGAPRDPDALDAISQGQRKAPNALYALVQTVLIQDEALKRAHDRIQELEGGAPEPAPQGGFLDSMRDALFGGGQQAPNAPRGSVPSVRPGEPSRAAWNTGQVIGQPQGGYGQGGYGQGGYGQAPMGQPMGQAPFGQQQAPQAGGGGGSFLGTAAAAAAGVVGGSLLMSSIRGMMGGNHQQGLADVAGGNKSPWGGDSNSSSGGSLANQAGLNDIGSSNRQGAGNFDQTNDRDGSNDRGGDQYAGNDQYADNDHGDYDDMDMDSDDGDYA